MKINRFVALAAIALLVVATMGVVSARAFAQTPHSVQSQDCMGENDTNETEATGDSDANETECNSQAQVDDHQDGETADDGEASPSGSPAITAETAQKTAEEYLNAGTAVKVELDNDDQSGQLIYSVQFSNGTDVIIDAMNGNVLKTEPTED